MVNHGVRMANFVAHLIPMQMKGWFQCFFTCVVILFFSCGTDEGTSTNVIPDKFKDSKELQELNKKILANPDVDSLYRLRAAIYLTLKDMELAEGDARRAIQIDSLNAENYLLLSDIFYMTNQTRNAKETLERCLRNLPENEEANLKMAELYFYVRKFTESLGFLDKVVKKDPYNSKSYYLKGMNFLEMGDTSKAVSSFQTAVEQDDQYFKAYMELAKLYALQKNRLAISYFDNALRISPNSVEAWCAKSKFFQDVGMIKEAREGYLKCLTVDSNCVDAAYNLGALVLSQDKTPDVAKVYFSRALIALSRFSGDGTFIVADTVKVHSSFLTYAQFRLSVAKSLFARGVCMEQLKDKVAARNDYQMALRVFENYEPALAALNQLGK
jgi:Tfp pilus assembly protein PilF